MFPRCGVINPLYTWVCVIFLHGDKLTKDNDDKKKIAAPWSEPSSARVGQSTSRGFLVCTQRWPLSR